MTKLEPKTHGPRFSVFLQPPQVGCSAVSYSGDGRAKKRIKAMAKSAAKGSKENSIQSSPLDFCHLITLSARARTFSGIVRPICLAVLRLMMNSNFFGCSTGKSAGLVALRILSRYVAARGDRAVVF